MPAPRHPVVLVHGLLARPWLMRPMRRALRGHGHDAHLADELAGLVTGDVRVHAEQLAETVARVLAETGAERVDLVGASQGGLVALWWAHTSGWSHVGRIVALGSPFRGAPLAGRLRPLGALAPGLRQLDPAGPFVSALGALPIERPVFSISVASDPVCPPAVTALPGMRPVQLAGGFGPLAHQLMMVDRRVTAAVHEALVRPC